MCVCGGGSMVLLSLVACLRDLSSSLYLLLASVIGTWPCWSTVWKCLVEATDPSRKFSKCDAYSIGFLCRNAKLLTKTDRQAVREMCTHTHTHARARYSRRASVLFPFSKFTDITPIRSTIEDKVPRGGTEP